MRMKKVLIECNLSNPVSFRDIIDCAINSEKIHLTKNSLALSNAKFETWFTQQNQWLAGVLTCAVSFLRGITMIKKLSDDRSTVPIINIYMK